MRVFFEAFSLRVLFVEMAASTPDTVTLASVMSAPLSASIAPSAFEVIAPSVRLSFSPVVVTSVLSLLLASVSPCPVIFSPELTTIALSAPSIVPPSASSFMPDDDFTATPSLLVISDALLIVSARFESASIAAFFPRTLPLSAWSLRLDFALTALAPLLSIVEPSSSNTMFESLSNTVAADVSVLPCTFALRLVPVLIIGSVVSTVTLSSVSSMLTASVLTSVVPFSFAFLMCSLQLCPTDVTIGPVPSQLPQDSRSPRSRRTRWGRTAALLCTTSLPAGSHR